MALLCILSAAQSQQLDSNSSSLAPKDNSWDVRSKAIDGVGMLNESQALNLLIEALADQNSSIRGKAALALGNYSDARSADALIPVLQDDNSQVADQSQDSLAKIGKLAILPLISALNNENSTIQAKAAQVLGRIGDPIAVDPLTQLMMKSNDSEVQTKAAYALRKLDWKEKGTS